jgi:hypothetical protein
MKRFASFAAVVLFGAVLAMPVLAGIADTPLPELEAGKKTYHLYSVPGIVSVGSYVAFFSCTSTDGVPIKIGVEAFAYDGSRQGSTLPLSVTPGATVVIGTNYPDWFNVDSVVGTGASAKLSARILATSKKVACTAFIAKGFNGGVDGEPTYPLTIIAKTKQKAAN